MTADSALAELAYRKPRVILFAGDPRAHILGTDVADALAIGWDAFRSAARDDLAGWEVTSAAAEVQPEPPLAKANCHTQPCSPPSVRGQSGHPG